MENTELFKDTSTSTSAAKEEQIRENTIEYNTIKKQAENISEFEQELEEKMNIKQREMEILNPNHNYGFLTRNPLILRDYFETGKKKESFARSAACIKNSSSPSSSSMKKRGKTAATSAECLYIVLPKLWWISLLG